MPKETVAVITGTLPSIHSSCTVLRSLAYNEFLCFMQVCEPEFIFCGSGSSYFLNAEDQLLSQCGSGSSYFLNADPDPALKTYDELAKAKKRCSKLKSKKHGAVQFYFNIFK